MLPCREANLKKQALGLIEGNMELIDRIQVIIQEQTTAGICLVIQECRGQAGGLRLRPPSFDASRKMDFQMKLMLCAAPPSAAA
eukprot:1139482-Pelagomonas_calceolata.AAC.3